MNWRLKDLESSLAFEIKNGDQIGRKDGHHTFPKNDRMSRVHAEFYIEEDKLYIKDLNSRNGTLLNGLKIIPDARVRIRKGDHLSAGDSRFVVENEADITSLHSNNTSVHVGPNRTITKSPRSELVIERHPAHGGQSPSAGPVIPQNNIMSDRIDKTYEILHHPDRSVILHITLRSLFLSIPTFGIYWAWGISNLKSYLWDSTSLNGFSFEYSGRPMDIIKGWSVLILVGVVLSFIPVIFTHFIKVNKDLLPILKWGFKSCLLLTYYHLILFQGFIYNLNHTSLKNIPFRYAKLDRGEYYFDILKFSAITVLTCGLYYPIMSIKLFERKFSHSYIGKESFKVKANSGDYFTQWWSGVILCIFTLGLYYPWFFVKMHQYRLNCLSLKGAKIISSLEGTEHLFFILKSILWSVLTLGMSNIFFYTRYQMFIVEHLTIIGKFEIDSFACDFKKERSRLSETVGSTMDGI